MMKYRLIFFPIIAVLIASFLIPGGVLADPLPERAAIKGVTGRAQAFSLSCESRSAVDWAAYWGVQIKERKFLTRLPRSDNPDKGFVGDAHGVWGNLPPASYGVHAEPVAALLRELGLHAEARQGLSWDELRAEIAAGRPVIVWVIGQMWNGAPVKYKSSDGKITRVARFEHTMIVTGYTAKSVQVVDAYTGLTLVYTKRSFLNSWSVLGNMAIIGGREQKPAEGDGSFASNQKIYLPLVLANQAKQTSPPEAPNLPSGKDDTRWDYCKQPTCPQ